MIILITVFAKIKFNIFFVLQITFQFQTRLCDDKNTLVDDSYKMKNPMQLVMGKNFKLEVWETIVQKMAVSEIAKFNVDKSVSSKISSLCKSLEI